MTEDEARNAVVIEAKSWLGTPYHDFCRIKGVGVDCAQLLIMTFSAIDIIEDFKPFYYSPQHSRYSNSEVYIKYVTRYANEVQNPKDGDIILFKLGRTFSHGAIVAGWPCVVHALRPRGVTTDNIGTHVLGRLQHKFFSLW